MKLKFLFVLCLGYALIPDHALAIEVGQSAPNFTLSNANDKSISLSQYKGKVIFIDFWASWCPPCQDALPWITQLQTKYKDRGLEVVAVNLDSEKESALKFISQFKNENILERLTVLFDTQGTVPTDYGVEGMPSSYLIDKQGKVHLIHRGFLEEDKFELEAKVKALLDI